jgi:hypothetical protein
MVRRVAVPLEYLPGIVAETISQIQLMRFS